MRKDILSSRCHRLLNVTNVILPFLAEPYARNTMSVINPLTSYQRRTNVSHRPPKGASRKKGGTASDGSATPHLPSLAEQLSYMHLPRPFKNPAYNKNVNRRAKNMKAIISQEREREKAERERRRLLRAGGPQPSPLTSGTPAEIGASDAQAQGVDGMDVDAGAEPEVAVKSEMDAIVPEQQPVEDEGEEVPTCIYVRSLRYGVLTYLCVRYFHRCTTFYLATTTLL